MVREPMCDGLCNSSGRSDEPGFLAGQDQHAGHASEAGRPGAATASLVHDLSNLLTVVLGSLEQLQRQTFDDRGQIQLHRAQWGARQAGLLARQVLATARGADDAEIVDLNEAVAGFGEIMGQVVGDKVSLVAELAPKRLPAKIDPGQLELALLNLVRNAADAMPGGGQVAIRTAGHRIDGLGGTPTVEVSVSDTGTGMTPEVAGKASEAFFTTKGRRHGTGIGLWMVQRFAAEAGGKVEIETALGQGTTVRLTLPRSEDG